MPISRGQTPRQLYGLGSFVKSIGKAVKGAVNTVKDVAKSPVGLAALTLGGAGLAGFGPAAGLRTSSLGNFLFGGATKFLPGATAAMKGAAVSSPGLFGSALNFLKTPKGMASAIGATSLLGGMFTAQEQEELEELRESGDPEKLKNYLRRYYSNLNINASPEEVESFVRANVAEGGRMQYAMGSPEENAMQASGIMGLPLNENPAGVTELDLRESGGFIPPVGVKEKADDIPAMLSNNEFVFTADAVRGMGDGNVNLGAQRMYDMMKKLENGGRV
jgi:hypothetical protein